MGEAAGRESLIEEGEIVGEVEISEDARSVGVGRGLRAVFSGTDFESPTNTFVKLDENEDESVELKLS